MARILVIDDEAAVRRMLRQMLEKAGYEVVEAPDGAVGLDLYHEHPTDLVITDILMPEKEGIETISTLRKIASGVRIIAISGGGRGCLNKEDVLLSARAFGAVRTLVKPFERQELLAVVQETLTQ